MSSDRAILVVEDDKMVRSSICLNLEAANYRPHGVDNGETALELIGKNQFDLVLCDLRIPQLDGISFVKKCRQIDPKVAVVVMSAFGEETQILEAIRAGAQDYIAKPFELDQLILTLRKVEEREHLNTSSASEGSELQKYRFSNIIAQSESMREIFETVKRLANFNTTVLITGESGTGKELIAHAIHHNSPRSGRPFIAINCGAIPETLMESELFGHRKGAFTDATRDKKGLFEEASGGTIFLDEIGEMPVHLQVKLLRALQEQKIRPVGSEELVDVDVRVIAATLRDSEQDVSAGRFRDDLFYRLNVVAINIPPLRERKEDITVLIKHFMKKHNRRLGLNIKQITPEATDLLLAYHWKGNVRELENCVERALVLTESEAVDVNSLPPSIVRTGQSADRAVAFANIDSDNLSIKQHTRALEIELIQRALKQTAGNRTHAAKILEISHRALLYKLKEYGISGN